MKNITHLAMLLLLSVNLIQAQETHVLKGQLLNAEDSTAIPFAHIGIAKLGIGCISNEDGQFEFNYPVGISDSISISHVTFDEQKIASAQTHHDTVFFLQPKTQELTEVLVFPKDSLAAILAQVKRRLLLNAPKKKHQLNAFYRELQYEEQGQQYTRLIEAAIDIEDKAYRKPLEKPQMRVLEMRKNDDKNEKSLMIKAAHAMFDINNRLVRCYANKENYPRSYTSSKGKYWWTPFNDSEGWKTDTLVVGVWDSGHILEIQLNANMNNRVFNRAVLMIDRRDYAILSIDYSSFYASKLIAEYRVKYKKHEGVYFPVLLKEKTFADLRKKSGTKTWVYSESTLMVNQILTDRKDIERIRKRDKMKKTVDLYDQDFEYNPDFWKHYNLLLKAPLATKVKNDLERKASLEDQFRKKGEQGKR